MSEAEGERLHAPFRARYGELLGKRLAGGLAEALPGTRDLVAAVVDHHHPTPGLLTGNYPETGTAKIAAAGFDPDSFLVHAWGVDGDTRRDLPRVAMARYGVRFGQDLDPAEVVVIGDTPKDVDCAHHNGCRAMAVTTGRFSRVELEAAGADVVFEDLADTVAILTWLGL